MEVIVGDQTHGIFPPNGSVVDGEATKSEFQISIFFSELEFIRILAKLPLVYLGLFGFGSFLFGGFRLIWL